MCTGRVSCSVARLRDPCTARGHLHAPVSELSLPHRPWGVWSAKHSLWLLTESAWRPLVCTRAASRAGTSGRPGRVLSLPSRPASWWRRSCQDERERLTLTAASSVEAPATLVTKGSQTLCLSSTYSLHPPMSSQNAEL